MMSVSSSTFHVWVTPKVTVSPVREIASSGSTKKEEHVWPLKRVRLPSVRSSQPLGADEGPADGTRLGILVGPADGRAEGATVGPVVGSVEGTLLGATVGPAVGPVEGALLGPAVGTVVHSQAKAMV
jgi:hypothetical protein